MDLLFLCSEGGRKSDINETGTIVSTKKTKEFNTVFHVTYVTVDCNSLLELKKN